MDNKIDYKFVTGKEYYTTKGYVPKVNNAPHANSGVTVATGFDLKEKNEQFLKDMGVEPLVINKLSKYFGLSGDKAQKKLDQEPLRLESHEAEELSRLAKAWYTSNIANQYEKATGYNKKFYDLSAAQQTVIYSVGYQYGSLNRTPTFLKHAVDNNWQEMYNELMDFNDIYPTRRKSEAELLLKELNDPLNIK